ncbi:MAG: amidohydrolase [Chloroflexi bacterium]|nr:amidohydrolase [Chloroflexota bacterium]
MLKRAHEIKEQLTAWRRDLHMHPELGFEETRTAARVVEILEPLGYRIRTEVGRTGVVADLGEGHPIVAIRADMDALPIQDGKDVPYASKTPGLMHACGHDAHTAGLLGVATLLTEEQFPGTVRLLFQPSEEKWDDEGKSGASRMIDDGAMEGVDKVLALHVDSDMDTGYMSAGAGPALAGADSFQATITGKGGHGAYPHKVVDPIYIAGHIILALNGIVSRRVHPVAPAVISIGAIHAGDAGNVIPEKVDIKGTIRYMEPDVQKTIHTEIERAFGMVRALGGEYALTIETGYPPMPNDAGVADLLLAVATDLLGTDHIRPHRREMGAEDFGYFSSLVPGALFRLGCKIEGDARRHHDPRFDVDERCLPIGTAILTEAALRLLRE